MRSRKSRLDAAVSMPGEGSATSLGLFVTGGLMLFVVFLIANPSFGAVKQWPWTFVLECTEGLLVSVVYALGAVTAVWALATGFTPARRLRAWGLLLLGAMLFLGIAEIKNIELSPMLAVILLGGGLLIARRPASRGVGRLLAGAGGLAFVWITAAIFSGLSGTSQLELLWRDLMAVFEDGADSFDEPHHFWWAVITPWLILLAAAGGVLAALGLTHRMFLLVVFCTLLLGVGLHPGGEIVLALTGDGNGSGLVSTLVDGQALYAFLLWLLGAFLALDLSHTKGRAV